LNCEFGGLFIGESIALRCEEAYQATEFGFVPLTWPTLQQKRIIVLTLPLAAVIRAMNDRSIEAVIEGLALLHGVLHPRFKDFRGGLRLGADKLPSLGLDDGDQLVVYDYPFLECCFTPEILDAVDPDGEVYMQISRGKETRKQIAATCFGTLRDVYHRYRLVPGSEDVWHSALHLMFHMADVVPREYERAYQHALAIAEYQEASDC